MKIILATPFYPPEIGESASYSKELATRLRDAHTIVIVAYASTSEEVPGTSLYTASKRRPLPIRLLKYTHLLFKASRNADVIYAENAIATGLPAVLVSWVRGIPLVVRFVQDEAWGRALQEKWTEKDLREFLVQPDGGWRTRFRMRLQGFVLRRARIVTVPSLYLAEILIHHYHIPRARTIVNYGVAEKTEVLPFSAQPIPHQIVTTARLVEWKGIDGVIRATARLAKEFSDVKLLIAGDGPEKERLRKLVAELGLEKHVTLLGRVSRAETWHIRKSSQVYVLNSTYEGLPRTALTSFAAGIPVVATNIPGTNEVIYDGESGLLVPLHNEEALVQAITRLFTDTTLRAHLVAGGQNILAEKFSWETHLSTLLSILESIRTNPHHKA